MYRTYPKLPVLLNGFSVSHLLRSALNKTMVGILIVGFYCRDFYSQQEVEIKKNYHSGVRRHVCIVCLMGETDFLKRRSVRL